MLKQFAGQGKTIEVKVKNNTLVFLFSTERNIVKYCETAFFRLQIKLRLIIVTIFITSFIFFH